MLRSICAVLGFVAFLAPRPPDVDAVAFVRAFNDHQADQYKNKQVSGTGVSFHPPGRERIADGSVRTTLVVTLGSFAADGQLTLLKKWDDFVAAETARTTLAIALSGPNLPDVTAEPARLTFSGVYDGQVRTIMRPPQAAVGGSSNDGPCPGEDARTTAVKSAFYCGPLLTGATATIVPQ